MRYMIVGRNAHMIALEPLEPLETLQTSNEEKLARLRSLEREEAAASAASPKVVTRWPAAAPAPPARMASMPARMGAVPQRLGTAKAEAIAPAPAAPTPLAKTWLSRSNTFNASDLFSSSEDEDAGAVTVRDTSETRFVAPGRAVHTPACLYAPGPTRPQAARSDPSPADSEHSFVEESVEGSRNTSLASSPRRPPAARSPRGRPLDLRSPGGRSAGSCGSVDLNELQRRAEELDRMASERAALRRREEVELERQQELAEQSAPAPVPAAAPALAAEAPSAASFASAGGRGAMGTVAALAAAGAAEPIVRLERAGAAGREEARGATGRVEIERSDRSGATDASTQTDAAPASSAAAAALWPPGMAQVPSGCFGGWGGPMFVPIPVAVPVAVAGPSPGGASHERSGPSLGGTLGGGLSGSFGFGHGPPFPASCGSTLWPFAPPYGHGHFLSSSFSPASGAFGHGAAQVASLVPVAKVVAVLPPAIAQAGGKAAVGEG